MAHPPPPVCPGFSRLNAPYGLSQVVVFFVLLCCSNYIDEDQDVKMTDENQIVHHNKKKQQQTADPGESRQLPQMPQPS